tara:strand:- start:572 stop:769 length:198 start_codon:yes stop_codon:yes gene_type:complete
LFEVSAIIDIDFLFLINQVIRSSAHEVALHCLTLVIQTADLVFKVLFYLAVDDFVIGFELLLTIS